ISVIGLSAEWTITVTGAPTGTEAAAGSTPIGGIVGVAVAAGTASGVAPGVAAGAAEAAGEAGGEGGVEASGAGAAAQMPAKPVRRRAKVRGLRNLRFGVANGRGEQRLIPDAGEEHGHEVALGAFDGSGSKLGVM